MSTPPIRYIIKQRSKMNDEWHDAISDPIQAIQHKGLVVLLLTDDWIRLNQNQRNLVIKQSSRLGISLSNYMELDQIKSELQSFSFININFRDFTDGIGYSLAVILRKQLNYTKELRASNVIADNLVLLEQCGFDCFKLTPGEPVDRGLKIFDQLVQ